MNAIYNLIAMAPPAGGNGSSSMLSTLVMFALIIGIFYFMILRPQQKRQKDRQKLLEGLQKGDKIITVGGLHGSIVGLEEKSILVQVADGVKLKFERSAIASIIRDGETIVTDPNK